MNIFKKARRIAAIVAAITVFTTITTCAITFPCTGYLTGDGVNIRSGPSTEYGSYGKIGFGEEVTLLGEENNWYKISTPLAACGYAYISSDYITTNALAVRDRVTYGGTSGAVSAGQRVVQIAEQFLGLPYVYGGSTPAGFDCSGFTSYVFKQMGYTLNRVSADQIHNGVPVSKSELKPGDLLLFKRQGASRIHHVGIYVGNGMMIHSPQTGDVIKYTSIVTGYYNNCYYTARRIVF